jgi:hypothetical protein
MNISSWTDSLGRWGEGGSCDDILPFPLCGNSLLTSETYLHEDSSEYE